MARKEVLIDDLDGTTEGATTFRFSVGDSSYEIDLAPANTEKVEKLFATVIAKSRDVTKGKNGNGNGGQSVAIRAWANAHGVEVSPKGKIPADVVEKYEAWKAEEVKRRGAEGGTAAKTPEPAKA